MSKKKKILLITAVAVLTAILIFGGVMTAMGWDFRKLSTVKYETNSHKISEEFKSISVITDTSDVVFVPCDDSEITVVCRESKKQKHNVSVKDGTLVIEMCDTRKWYEYIGLDFGKREITVNIPQGEYKYLSVKNDTGDINVPSDFSFVSIDISADTGDVKCHASASCKAEIETTTGGIDIKDISAGSLDLTVSTGNIDIRNVKCHADMTVNVSTGNVTLDCVSCNKLTSNGSTGNLKMKGVAAIQSFNIERSTGDVQLETCDAREIYITTDTGDIKGSLMSEKVFIVRSDTGKIDVPKTISGGRCELTTDTGDIIVEIMQFD